MKTLPYLSGLVAGAMLAAVSAGAMSEYQNAVLSHQPTHYWTFDGTLQNFGTAGEATLVHLAPEEVDLIFGEDFFQNAASAWEIRSHEEALMLSSDPVSGGGSGPDENAEATGSLTMLFRTPASTTFGGQRFIFSQGDATGPNNAFSLFFENNTNSDPNSLKMRLGNNTRVVQPASYFKPNTWYFFALTWNEARNTPEAFWHIGELGQELSSAGHDIANQAVVGNQGSFYIGNRSGEPRTSGFRNPDEPARIDEFALYDYELSPQQIEEQFALASALPPPPPTDGMKYFQEVVVDHGPAYYWQLDGDLTNAGSAGTATLAAVGTGGSFTWDLFGAPEAAYQFANTSDGLRAAFDPMPDSGGWFRDENATGIGSVGFIFRAPETLVFGGQRFLFAQGNSTGDGNAFALFFENNNNNPPNSLKLRIGNTTQAIAEAHELTGGEWYYFAVTWDEARNDGEVNWHLGEVGGELMSGVIDIANDAVVGDASHFILGNNLGMNNAFRNPSGDVGIIDEFAIYHFELSPEQIAEQFLSLTDVLSGPDLSPIEQWRELHFGTTANEGDAADGADPSGDGVRNLLKYALGLDPNEASRAAVDGWNPGLPSASVAMIEGDAHLVLTYHRDTTKTEITYAVEAGSNLVGWSTDEVVDVVVATEGSLELREARIPLDGSRGFLRLSVSRTE